MRFVARGDVSWCRMADADKRHGSNPTYFNNDVDDDADTHESVCAETGRSQLQIWF